MAEIYQQQPRGAMSRMRITTNFFKPTEASSHDKTKTRDIWLGHSFGQYCPHRMWHQRTPHRHCAPSSFTNGESIDFHIPVDNAVIKSCVLVNHIKWAQYKSGSAERRDWSSSRVLYAHPSSCRTAGHDHGACMDDVSPTSITYVSSD